MNTFCNVKCSVDLICVLRSHDIISKHDVYTGDSIWNLNVLGECKNLHAVQQQYRFDGTMKKPFATADLAVFVCHPEIRYSFVYSIPLALESL